MLPIRHSLEKLVTDHSSVLDRIVANRPKGAQSAMSELISHSFADAITNLRQVGASQGGKQVA